MSIRQRVLLHGLVLVLAVFVMVSAAILRSKGTWTQGLFMREDWFFTMAGFVVITLMVRAFMSGKRDMLASSKTRYWGPTVYYLNLVFATLFIMGFLVKLPA